MTRCSVSRLWQFRVLLLCCLLGSAVVPASAQLALGMSTTRTQYLTDEFLYVTITLENVGTQDVPFTRLLDPAVGIVSFEIMTPDGQSYSYEPRGRAALSQGAPERSILWLAPGGRYTNSVDLSYELRRVPGKATGMYEADGVIKPLPGPDEVRPAMLLSAPGEYSIRACYAVPEGWPLDPVTLWSNELHVSVVEPTGTDLGAYNVILTSPYGEGREEPWNVAAEEAEYYEQVIRDYPTSIYAIYARRSLASIHSSAGSHALRGRPEALERFRSAAALFVSAAQQAGQTPLGMRVTEAAAKNLARLGRNAEAQALLEDAFIWPTTTDSDRTRLLAWMQHIETGYFQREAGAVPMGATTQLSLPLRSFARALGFSVGWVPDTKSAVISTSKVTASIQPGHDYIMVNGTRRVGVRAALEEDRLRVSPSVIATLMAEHYGKGMANAFPTLIAKTEQ